MTDVVKEFGEYLVFLLFICGIEALILIVHDSTVALFPPSLNFCPDVCDDCVDKQIRTPATHGSEACEPVWVGMDEGYVPIQFTRYGAAGYLETHTVEYSCHITGDFGTRMYDLTGRYRDYDEFCHPLGAKIWQSDFNYLYTYQIQNEVQFDFCVQEYYKQHFGGAE